MIDGEMKNEFSTFELAEIIGVNRNTLQSALAGGFITPDIHQADGPGERSRFSREAVYNAALFFQLVKVGWPRRKAKKDADLDWSNVGPKGLRYSIRIDGALRPPMISIGEWKISDKLPPEKNGEVFRLTVNLLVIKNQVDKAIGQ